MVRILLVENDPAHRTIMHHALAGAGHDVTVAEDGRDGRAALAEGPPFDLVLAEMALPGLDGIELAAEVSRDYPGTRVLVMATHAGLANGKRPGSRDPNHRRPFPSGERLAQLQARFAPMADRPPRISVGHRSPRGGKSVSGYRWGGSQASRLKKIIIDCGKYFGILPI